MRLIKKVLFFLFLIFYTTSGFSQDSEQSSVLLNAEELAWLNNHPVIRVHNETNWPPFNFAENGTAKGYSIDFMNLLARKTGLN